MIFSVCNRPFFSQGIPTSSSMAEDMEHVGQSEPSPDNSQDTVKHLQVSCSDTLDNLQ